MSSSIVPLPIHQMNRRSKFLYNFEKKRWYGEALKHENGLSKIWVMLDNFSMFPDYIRLQNVRFGYVRKDWDYDTSYVNFEHGANLGSNIVGIVMEGNVINKNKFEGLYKQGRKFSKAMSHVFSRKWDAVHMCFPNLSNVVNADKVKYREVFDSQSLNVHNHLYYVNPHDLKVTPNMLFGVLFKKNTPYELGVLVDQHNSDEGREKIYSCLGDRVSINP